MVKKSTQAISDENISALTELVEAVESGLSSVPMRNGGLYMAGIWRMISGDSSASRHPSWFTTKAEAAELIERLRIAVGDLPPTTVSEKSAKEVRLLESRVTQLETQVASLLAENDELRRDLKRRDFAQDHLEATGRTLW